MLSLTLKGFNYTAFYNGAYANADSLSTLAATNANVIATNIEYGIDVTTSTVYADTSYTDSLADLGATISEATGLGLGVMDRPLIDFVAPAKIGTYSVGDWRAYYNPTDPAAFFASYKTLLVAEATAAQATGASLFCIGTELDQLTGAAYLADWTGIITAVRAVFTGKLTYSAIWDDKLSPWAGQHGLTAGTGNLANQVSFWNQLDYVGVDVYAPLSDAANPTLAQLEDGWTKVPTDPTSFAVTGQQSLIQYFDGVAATVGKPMIFTELGYEPVTDAASQPAYSSTNVYDPALQQNLYSAFFDAWRAQGDGSLKGVYLWNWDPNTANAGVGSFMPVSGTRAAVTTAFAACYAEGTRIATLAGDVAVEALTPGTWLPARFAGRAPVRWLGHRRIDCRRHPRPAEVWPVRVEAGAFGPGLPVRDLRLSPDHAVFVEGVLIPIRHLVNGRTIRQEQVPDVTYWHVELPRHDVIFAEGLPAESYLDTANRDAFDNAGTVLRLHPGFAARAWSEAACAPLVQNGAEIAVARSLLLERAGPLGHAITRDPAAAAFGDSRPLTVEVAGRFLRIRLPRPAQRFRLASRAAIPAWLDAMSDDPRRLGLAVARLWLDGEAVGLDDPRLGAGWHAIETGPRGASWRWTDGDAALATGAARRVDIELAMTTRYWDDAPYRRRAV